MIDINVERSGSVTIVELQGELDSNSAAEAQEQILPLAGPNSKILLDLSKITYMSSAGLRTLLLLYRKISENAGRIVVAGLSDEVRDIMAITGFLDFFETVEDRRTGLVTLD